MKVLLAIIGAVVAACFFLVLLALVLSVPVWLLWNWVAVAVLGLNEITLLQALGLTLLSSILFKSGSVSSKS